jgi:NADH-quinone oxidoreductase subunit M
MAFPVLTSIVALPVVGAILLLLVRPGQARPGVGDGEAGPGNVNAEPDDPLSRRIALVVSVLVFAETLLLWSRFVPGSADFQFVEIHEWIPAFGIRYAVGVDGISLFLLVLTGLLTPLALLSSWESVLRNTRAFCVFVLLLESAMMGVFVSLDLFLFYVFWDAMLVPMYFLIGMWGYERRVYAAVKFILYTMAGSVLMLVAILGLAYVHSTATGSYSFDLLKLYDLRLTFNQQYWFFLAFAIAFAIKVPLFPFHTWLPDAHVEAPTAGSVILAGVLLKMGTYGLVRFAFPLFPEAAVFFAPALGVLAVIGIVYGALVAMVQPDLKKLVAYSSVSHLGFVVLGITAMNAQGVEGAVYQMLNHGVNTGGLFMIVGMLSDRRHTRLISAFGGLKKVMPRLVAAFLLVTLSSIGLPGLNGFVGEFLILLGTFRVDRTLTTVATSGVILSAAYMLWMFQRVNYGPVTRHENERLVDLSSRESLIIVPIAGIAVLMGVLPNLFLRPIEPSVDRMLNRVQRGAPQQIRAARVGVGPPAGKREDAREPCGASVLRVRVSPEPLRSAKALSNSGGGGVPAARIMMVGLPAGKREDTREPCGASVLRVGVGPHAGKKDQAAERRKPGVERGHSSMARWAPGSPVEPGTWTRSPVDERGPRPNAAVASRPPGSALATDEPGHGGAQRVPPAPALGTREADGVGPSNVDGRDQKVGDGGPGAAGAPGGSSGVGTSGETD